MLTEEQKKSLRCYDNEGKTADRYTVVFMNEPERGNLYNSLGMNAYPFHPQGIGMHGSAQPGRHLGRRIKFEVLPEDCQKAVAQHFQE